MMIVNDDLLKELYLLEMDVKHKTKQIEFIKDLCKAKGTFSTRNFVVAVNKQSRTGMAPLDKVKAVFGEDVLKEHNLIVTSEYLTVKLSIKNPEILNIV